MALISAVVDISLVAVLLVVVSRLLQGRMIDKDRQKAAQARMKEKQGRIKELMKNEDERSKNEMKQLQQEIFEEMNETMQGSMKYMIVSLPLFLAAWWLMGWLYGGQLFATPFAVPKFDGFFFLNPFTWIPSGWVLESGYAKWYIVVYFIVAIVLGIAMKVREKIVKK
jgi:uncharacterized membrane protein (DUF106 family)